MSRPVIKSDSPALSSEVHRLEENMPTTLADHKVVAFNIWARAYKDAKGTEHNGPAASFSDGTTEQVVGVGSELKVGEMRYRVTDVGLDGKGQAAYIKLQALVVPGN